MTETDEIARSGVGVLEVDGDYYPVNLDSYSAEHDQILRNDLGVSVRAVEVAVSMGIAGAVEIVAVMMLSLLQDDQPADARWLRRHIRSDSAMSIVSGFDPIPA